MFDQDQIQEFKEAFNMIDQNRDGFIDHDDLKDMLASLGKVRLSLLFCLLRLSAFKYCIASNGAIYIPKQRLD